MRRFRRSATDAGGAQQPAATPNMGAFLRRIFADIDSLRVRLNKTRAPAGTEKAYPARSCRDVLLTLSSSGQVANGTYWIDPNLGSPEDALEVTCEFYPDRRTAQTCVSSGNLFEVSSSTTDNGWLQMSTRVFFESDLPDSQLRFLQLAHRRAKETMTLFCQKGAGTSSLPVVYADLVADKSKPSYAKAADALLSNGKTVNIHADKSYRASPVGRTAMNIRVADDRCGTPTGDLYGSAVIEFIAEQPGLLPIQDLRIKSTHGSYLVEKRDLCFYD